MMWREKNEVLADIRLHPGPVLPLISAPKHMLQREICAALVSHFRATLLASPLPSGPIFGNMMSSTEREVHNILQVTQHC